MTEIESVLEPVSKRKYKTPTGVLRATYRLFNDKRRWITNLNAVDNNEREVSATSSKAVCFCIAGAIDRFSANNKIFESAVTMLGGLDHVVEVNDFQGYSAIRKALRKALKGKV